MMPDNEVRPVMESPKASRLRPVMGRPGRTGSSRTIGAAYTGAVGFRQRGEISLLAPLKPRNFDGKLSE
jgi:hypothetical protein